MQKCRNDSELLHPVTCCHITREAISLKLCHFLKVYPSALPWYEVLFGVYKTTQGAAFFALALPG